MAHPIVCIINPRAASGRAGRAWPGLLARLEAHGFAVEAHFTTAAGDGTRLAREALRAGARTLVAVGGDGTIHEVVNGFSEGDTPLGPDARLGILPIGSGSDLVRTLGIPTDPAGAVACLERGEARRIDIGRVHYTGHDGTPQLRHFANTTSAGISANVLKKQAHMPAWFGGPGGYLAATLLAMASFRPVAITLEVDGETRPPRRAFLLVVGNGRYFGGGMCVAPTARLDDGRFEVLLLREAPLLALVQALIRVYAGRHLALPIVEHIQASRMAIAADGPLPIEIDGEQPGVGPVTIELLPAALAVIAGPRAPGAIG